MTFTELLHRVPKETPNQSLYKRLQGRPSKYSRELAIYICIRLSEERGLKNILKENRINRTTFWRWIKKHPELRSMIRLTNTYVKLRKDRYFADLSLEQRKAALFLQQLSKEFSSPNNRLLPGPGRPSKYDPLHCRKVKNSWSKTARSIGVSKRTICSWATKYPDFRRQLFLKWAEKELKKIDKDIEAVDEGFTGE